ncbi:hypothetical protein [Pseudophaeobacter sp. TrK17]|uniref:hypothetical protein n=1 Tax=Pseudophaeobacter sp. TrK17 TaxID=2815167 RepID=UPI0035CF4535
MDTPKSFLDVLPSDRRKEGKWVAKQAYYLLWFDYLAISPSYELARRHRSGTLRDKDRERIPADFDAVLRVYDDLRNVQRVLFPKWWRDVGFDMFGAEGEAPRVTRIGRLNAETEIHTLKSQAFAKGAWVQQGKQPTMLVAIPLGMPKGRITRQLNAMINRFPEDERYIKPPNTKYPLLGKRHHSATLFRYLFTVWVRGLMPDKELWRVGVRARVSETYSSVLRHDAQVVPGQDRYDREMLTIITSRALLRGRMIAENAARGRFPSYATCPHAVEFDYPEVNTMVHHRRKWQKAETSRILENELNERQNVASETD